MKDVDYSGQGNVFRQCAVIIREELAKTTPNLSSS
jgi:hypothetical protein